MKCSLVQNEDELSQILTLQQANLKQVNSKEKEAREGFVTVRHEPELLKSMNDAAAHIIAKDNDIVIGYALTTTRAFKDKIPALFAMFELLDNIKLKSAKLGDEPYLVMGQICINELYRGKGVFRELYRLFFEIYLPIYKTVITEVASRNIRSLNAHLNIGFEEIYRYDEPGVEEWVVIRYH